MSFGRLITITGIALMWLATRSVLVEWRVILFLPCKLRGLRINRIINEGESHTSDIYFARTSSRSSSDLSRMRMSMETNLEKMCCYNSMIIVISLFLILFCDQTSSECTQLAPCICSLPDGRYYNLTELANAKPFVDNKYNWTVLFHPCTNVKMEIDMPNNTMCAKGSGVSLCMYNKKNDTLTGTIEETRMKLSTEGPFPIFEIYHNNIKSMINIVCFSDKKTSFMIDDPFSPKDSKENYFKLVSPYGCVIQPERGLSTGSVLVILFFVCAGIYFIGGIIVLKTLRGATGWEMVPNHDFWCKLPLLVKDGVIFTFNCCRADSYERI